MGLTCDRSIEIHMQMCVSVEQNLLKVLKSTVVVHDHFKAVERLSSGVFMR